MLQTEAACNVLIREDYFKTGKCQLAIAKGVSSIYPAIESGWVVAKNSPFYRDFNLG